MTIKALQRKNARLQFALGALLVPIVVFGVVFPFIDQAAPVLLKGIYNTYAERPWDAETPTVYCTDFQGTTVCTENRAQFENFVKARAQANDADSVTTVPQKDDLSRNKYSPGIAVAF